MVVKWVLKHNFCLMMLPRKMLQPLAVSLYQVMLEIQLWPQLFSLLCLMIHECTGILLPCSKVSGILIPSSQLMLLGWSLVKLYVYQGESKAVNISCCKANRGKSYRDYEKWHRVGQAVIPLPSCLDSHWCRVFYIWIRALVITHPWYQHPPKRYRLPLAGASNHTKDSR